MFLNISLVKFYTGVMLIPTRCLWVIVHLEVQKIWEYLRLIEFVLKYLNRVSFFRFVLINVTKTSVYVYYVKLLEYILIKWIIYNF